MTSIHLGFEIGTGKAIAVPVAHMAVTGQTQASGKTTTLEALVSRSGATALTFVTKRGEGSFAAGRRIEPYFRDRADWQFVTSILDATLQEKNKFLRPWIMKICRDTETLAEVQDKVREALLTAKGINEGVYTQLDAYLDLLVPEIRRANLAPTLDLAPGINVMDVSGFATPMQMLFVQSAIDWVNEQSRKTIIVVPEAWEFIPEGKGSPVKASAVTLVRKGAGIGNFIWVDSQDMAGVDKTILRGCTVWLIGVQREANEIKRNLQNIPAGIGRPRAEEVATLERGQFFACFGRSISKVYVQPAWADDETARGVALGATTIESIIAQMPKEAEVNEREAEELRRRNSDLTATVARLEAQLAEPKEALFIDPKTIEEAKQSGYERGASDMAASAQQAFVATRSALASLVDMLNSQIAVASDKAAFAEVDNRPARDIHSFEMNVGGAVISGSPAPMPSPKPERKPRAPADPNAVAPGADRLLNALARLTDKTVNWDQAALAAGILSGNGYFYVAKKYLTGKGLATDQSGVAAITKDGLKAIGGKGAELSRNEVLQIWRGKVKAPGALMLDAIASRPSQWIDTVDLAKKIGAKAGNAYWYGGIKAIRKAGLIEQDSLRFRLSEFVRGLS